MTQLNERNEGQQPKSLGNIFFVVVKNRPDWYQIVVADQNNDQPPRDAVLVSQSPIPAVNYLKEKDIESLVYKALEFSEGVKRTLAKKVAMRLLENPDLAKGFAQKMLDAELIFRREYLDCKIRDHLNHFHGDENDMANDLEFLQTFEHRQFQFPAISQVIDIEGTSFAKILSQLRTNEPAENKFRKIVTLLEKGMTPDTLSNLIKFVGFHYGEAVSETNLKFEDRRFSIDVPNLLMKHWQEVSQPSDGEIKDAFLVTDKSDAFFYIRRDFVERKIQTMRLDQ